jgi:predicted TIM-barrel fold metal-dependent hydrolase
LQVLQIEVNFHVNQYFIPVNKKQQFSAWYLLIAAALLPWVQGCRSGTSDYYDMQDFNGVEKIDIHAHALIVRPGLVEQAKADNFVLVSLNTEVPDYPPIDSQQSYVLQLRHSFPNQLYYVSTFETSTINLDGWAGRQLEYLKNSFNSGALGIKVWKNIGMAIKDRDSNFIMIDNPVFDPIFNYLEANNIPVIGHIGEPKNCWLPLAEMTTNNDRTYFKEHPEYHMYLHPEFLSYDSIIQSRDNLLKKHPKLRFVGAHLGSMEWSVDEIAARLDQFPNMCVETAERFGQLQFQSIRNWQKVHDFFIKYQDRIMYGTDLEDNASLDKEVIGVKAHELWLRDWRYFTSGDSLESPFVNAKFKGLKLPREVVDKIYTLNPRKWYFNK